MSIASVGPDDFAGDVLDSEKFKFKNCFGKILEIFNVKARGKPSTWLPLGRRVEQVTFGRRAA